MTLRQASWGLFLMAATALAIGVLPLALLLGLFCGLLAVLAPDPAREDARRRNQAHRP